MRSSLSFAALVAIAATSSGAIIPLNEIRLPGRAPSSLTGGGHVPAWFASLIAALPLPDSSKPTSTSHNLNSVTTTSMTRALGSDIPTPSPSTFATSAIDAPSTITPAIPPTSLTPSSNSQAEAEPVTSVLTVTPVHDQTP
jgi:hypothetical protein